MGTKAVKKPAKEVKTGAKETPASQSSGNAMGTVAQDWPGFQAYSPMPPYGYMTSSPPPHPYIWGVQHLMPPYGATPHPYVMYPHGGMYPHPSMHPGSYPFSPYPMPSPNGVAEASGKTPGSMEVNGKSRHAKEKLPIKRSKGGVGSLNTITGKNNEINKRADCGSEGSSIGSDANSENNAQMKSGLRHSSMEGEASQNGGVVNQTMSAVPMPAVIAAGSREHMQQPQVWVQDEREVKRQRRKQSNRESAHRSRIRKQAECDELAQRADTLNEENVSLRAQVSHLGSDYQHLLAENASLKERLGETTKQQKCIENRQDELT